MKKLYILFGFLLTFMLHATPQFCEQEEGSWCDREDWNWLDKSKDNWKMYNSDGNIVCVGSPFDLNSPSAGSHDIDDILSAKDYTQEAGWELLHKNFGCFGAIDWPYFMLYNKYKGIIRLFQYGSDEGNANGAKVTLRWKDGSNKTALLSPTNTHAYTTSHYHPYNIPEEMALNYIKWYYEDSWFVTDFNVGFDHFNNCGNSNLKLYFETSVLYEYKIDLDGTFEFETKLHSQSLKGDKASKTASNDPESPNIKKVMTDSKKFLEKVPSEKDMKKSIDNTADGLDKFSQFSCKNFGDTEAGERFSDKLFDLSSALGNSNSDLVKVLVGASKLASTAVPVLSTAIGVFDFFVGKGNSSDGATAFQPTVSSGTMKLSGTMKSEENTLPITLQLPGTKHQASAGMPFYNYPLGVTGLEEEPDLKIRKWTETTVKYSNLNVVSVSPRSGRTYDCNKRDVPSDKYRNYDKTNVSENWKSVRINSDLQIALNGYAGLEVVDCRASLVARIRPSANPKKPAYSLDEETIPENNTYIYADDYHCFGKGCYEVYLQDCKGTSLDDDNPWRNKTLDYLNKGIYNLTNIDSAGFAEFSTPLINVENFKNTSITVREETDLFIKVFTQLMPTDPNVDQTPVTLWNMYRLTDNTEDNDESSVNSPFPFTRLQLSEISYSGDLTTSFSNQTISSGTYTNWNIETTGNVTVNPSSGNVNFNAYNAIDLNPGFVATPTSTNSFNAQIINAPNIVDAGYTPIEQLVTTYTFSECELSTKSASSDYLQKINFNSDDNIHRVFPNPNNGSFTVYLNLSNGETADLFIYNSMGSLIKQVSAYERETHIDCGNINTGFYIVKIVRGSDIKTEKVLIQ